MILCHFLSDIISMYVVVSPDFVYEAQVDSK
jgi:hypothetical protein